MATRAIVIAKKATQFSFDSLLLYQNLGLRDTPRPCRNACVFSHLYPPPPYVVVGLITTMCLEARFTSRMLGFYSRFWIWVSENTP
jgi:hypothetical protein